MISLYVLISSSNFKASPPSFGCPTKKNFLKWFCFNVFPFVPQVFRTNCLLIKSLGWDLINTRRVICWVEQLKVLLRLVKCLLISRYEKLGILFTLLWSIFLKWVLFLKTPRYIRHNEINIITISRALLRFLSLAICIYLSFRNSNSLSNKFHSNFM